MFDKNLLSFTRMKSMLAKLCGLAFLQSLLIIIQATSLANAIVKVWSGKPLESTILSISIFACSFILRNLLINYRSSMLDKYADVQVKKLRLRFLNHIFAEGANLTSVYGNGNLITMSLNGMDQVRTYIKLMLSKTLNMFLVPLVILVYICFLDLFSGFVLLIAFPIIIIFMVILGKLAKSKANRQYAKYQQLANHFIDSLRGLKTLKYLGLSKRYEKSIYQTSENFRKATMATLRVGMLSSFALDFFATLSVAVVAVFLGIRLIHSQIAFLPALIVLMLAPEYFLPIRSYANDYHATLNGKNAFRKILKIVYNPIKKTQALEIKSWSNSSSLKLQNINVCYGQKMAIENVSLNVSGLQKVGIIGLSGSGKSTLIDILSGFLRPTKGTIQVDNMSVSDLHITEHQKQIAYIPQKPYLFQTTLRENLTFYYPEASEQDILEAIKICDFQSLVDNLDNGLETIVGENARPLSGGQRQRIELARIFLDKRKRILFFDEPTAHLDLETEMELKEQMLPFMEDKLVFFATHRLHWLKNMDEIIVLDNGKIIERGSYDELKQNEHFLRKMSIS